jgi:hypothetical protein
MGSLSKLPPEVARELRRHVSPRPLQQMAAKAQQKQKAKSGAGGWVLPATLLFTGGAFTMPFIAQQWIGNLNARDEHLTGPQIRRGAFQNSGSKDVGKDPQWDFRKGEYKKDDNYWAIFDGNAVERAFGSMVSATGEVSPKSDTDKSPQTEKSTK